PLSVCPWAPSEGHRADLSCRPMRKALTSFTMSGSGIIRNLSSRSGLVNFDELDARMRIFETGHDHCVLPGIHMVARIDGRHFTRLTKEIHQFQAPYDERFRDYMVETIVHLMSCGFRVIYAYTQSDEISLLFHLDESMFGRKERK